MNQIANLSATARQAIRIQNWPVVADAANKILAINARSPEAWFLAGMVHKSSNEPVKAVECFRHCLQLDNKRYDAGIELANQFSVMRKNGDAVALLERYEPLLGNSPLYLDLAGTLYCDVGMPDKAWPLFTKANELQPGIDLFQANLATCAVYLGRIDKAKSIYISLLERNQGHRQNHYQLSRLEKVRDDTHLTQMLTLEASSKGPADKDIFLFYAIAKELEDLGRWDEAFDYYKKGGDAVCSVANYNVNDDVDLIETIMNTCTSDWLNDRLNDGLATPAGKASEKCPIFVIGLPRSGTTLTERIISSHSSVESVGETLFIQMLLRQHSNVQSREGMNTEMIKALAAKDLSAINNEFVDALRYRLGDEPYFIEKLPLNFMYLGFIAKIFPNAKIVLLDRNPMDVCFSMYKQIFTWAYKFSYSLEDLGHFYIAYNRLLEHWKSILGDRIVEVSYEKLVANPEDETRLLLDKLGLPFEEACLNFETNPTPSTTASSVQIRQKAHTDSVEKWRRFERQLTPLKDILASGGLVIESGGA